MFDRLAQAVATLSPRVAAPVADYVAVGGDYERLRDRVFAAHQCARRQWVGPAQAEAEINAAHELLHAIGRRARVFGCQTDELHGAAGVLLAHFLVVGNFHPARAAPRRPNIHDDDFAAEVREAKAALVERLQFAVEKAFWQRAELYRRRRQALGSYLRRRFNNGLSRGRRIDDSSARLGRGVRGKDEGDEAQGEYFFHIAF